jgi:hypothetical protein
LRLAYLYWFVDWAYALAMLSCAVSTERARRFKVA